MYTASEKEIGERRQAGSCTMATPNIFKYKEKGKFINTVQRVYAEL